MNPSRTVHEPAPGQAGFTLVEALIAIVILAVGLVAVTNLFLVAASSNQMGNATTGAATQASETLERLKTVDFCALTPGGNPNMQQDLPAANPASANPDIFVGGALTYNSYRTLPGVGTIRTRWSIENPNSALTPTRFITVESQVLSTFGGAMTKSQFTTFRTCTGAGCPGSC
jgi:prepilin-type N-terminal cleavage/methylation domain-containing protein